MVLRDVMVEKAQDMKRRAEVMIEKLVRKDYGFDHFDVVCDDVDISKFKLLESNSLKLMVCTATDYGKRDIRDFVVVANVERETLSLLKGIDKFDG